MLKLVYRISVILLIVMVFGLIGPAHAVDALSQGPKVGSKIPHALSANDQNSKMQNFDSLKGKNGLILFFTRSFDW
jgi:hypothetical protein